MQDYYLAATDLQSSKNTPTAKVEINKKIRSLEIWVTRPIKTQQCTHVSTMSFQGDRLRFATKL